MPKLLGVLPDTRTPEQKEFDITHKEIFGASVPNYLSSLQSASTYVGKFPVDNQFGTSSCVAHGKVLVMSIFNYLQGITPGDFIQLASMFIYPLALSAEWIVWRQQSEEVATALGADNAASASIASGHRIHVIGNGNDKFQRARDSVLNGLVAAKHLLTQAPLFTPAAAVQKPKDKSNRVFIVHGHDHVAKNELENYLTELGLDPVVLHRQPDEGNTIIEKFEKYSDVGFAFILLTPDEIAYPIADDIQPDTERRKERRARPNVVLEFGYFVGRLGRPNVCCIYSGNVSLPSDVHGILYKEFHKAIKEVFYDIRKELLARQYKLSQ